MLGDSLFNQLSDTSGNYLCRLENFYKIGELNLNENSKNWFNITTNDRSIRHDKYAFVWNVPVPDTGSRLWWFRYHAKRFNEAKKNGRFLKSSYSKIVGDFPEDKFDNYFIANSYNEKNNKRVERLLPNIPKLNQEIKCSFRALELEEYIEDKTNEWYYFDAIALMQLTPLVEKKLHPSPVWFNLDTGNSRSYGDNQVTILINVRNEEGATELIKKDGIVTFVNQVKHAWDVFSSEEKKTITNEAYNVLSHDIGFRLSENDLSFNYHLVIPSDVILASDNNQSEDTDLSLLGSMLGGGLGL